LRILLSCTNTISLAPSDATGGVVKNCQGCYGRNYYLSFAGTVSVKRIRKLIVCRKCGRDDRPNEGGGLCRRCYQAPERKCRKCKTVRPHQAKGYCRFCYPAPKRACVRCGRKCAPCGDGLCKRCYKPPLITCRKCGEVRFHQADQLCKPCYRSGANGKDVQTLKAIVSTARGSARKRGIDFQITAEDITLPDNCNFCGERIDYDAPNRMHHMAATVNRIDASLGYCPGNVEIIHRVCNLTLGRLCPALLEKFIEYYARHNIWPKPSNESITPYSTSLIPNPANSNASPPSQSMTTSQPKPKRTKKHAVS
jgi:hypothetical protein